MIRIEGITAFVAIVESGSLSEAAKARRPFFDSGSRIGRFV